jgi:hypothetical protein
MYIMQNNIILTYFEWAGSLTPLHRTKLFYNSPQELEPEGTHPNQEFISDTDTCGKHGDYSRLVDNEGHKARDTRLL